MRQGGSSPKLERSNVTLAMDKLAWQGADRPAPCHVAIIMDGNGRWAAARGLPRGEGHRRGVEALRRTVRAAGDLGIAFLTIFSFSAENWTRPPAEIRELMGLLRRFIRHDLADLHRRGVRVRVIGEREDLDPGIRRLVNPHVYHVSLSQKLWNLKQQLIEEAMQQNT